VIAGGVFRPYGTKNTEKEEFGARGYAARAKLIIFLITMVK